MKMRLIAFALFFAFWSACVVAAINTNEPFVIQNLAHFRELHKWAQESSADFTVDIELKCDLNFSTWGEDFFPLGQHSSSEGSNPYNGVFNGNGHTISNLVIDRECRSNGDAGLFEALGHATVKNLHFDSSCLFRGIWAGAVAVKADSGTVKIINVSSAARVETCGVSGGIVGMVSPTSSNSIHFERCRNTGSVSVIKNKNSDYFGAGGIVGLASFDTGGNVTVRDCHNSGPINATIAVSTQSRKEMFAGGIISCQDYEYQGRLVIEDCSNNGTVDCLIEYNTTINNKLVAVGGIAAIGIITDPTAPVNPVVVHRCHNRGSVNMYVNKTDLALLAGGVVAAFETKTYDPVVTNVLECTNRGAVSITLTAESGDAYAAGVVATHRPLVDVSSCENFGSITSSSNASGIASAAIGITNSVNHGPVNGALSSHGIAFTISKTAVAIASTVCAPDTVPLFGTDLQPPVTEVFYCSSTQTPFSEVGAPMHNTSAAGDWVTTYDGKSVAAMLNRTAASNNYPMVWSEALHIGYPVTFSSDTVLPGPLAHNPCAVAEPGETLQDLLVRVGADALLGWDYTLDDANCTGPILAACTVRVERAPATHTLVFALDDTRIQVEVARGTLPPREPIAPYLDTWRFVIVRAGTTDDYFDPAAPVLADAAYTIVRTSALDVVVDGSGADADDLVGAVDAIAGPDAVVRIVAVEPRPDGTVRVVLVVEDRCAQDVIDTLQQCLSTTSSSGDE